MLGPGQADHRLEPGAAGPVGAGVVAGLVLDQLQVRVRDQIRRCERVPDLGRGDLLAGDIGDLLDHPHELDLETARKIEVVVVLEDVGDAALPGLAVDPDDRLVGPAYVERVDWKVRHIPDLAL